MKLTRVGGVVLLGLVVLAWGCGPTEYESEGPASSAQGSSLAPDSDEDSEGSSEGSEGREDSDEATGEPSHDRADEPRPCLGWEEGAFEYAADQTSADFEPLLAEIACDGPQFRRFDAAQGLWVGLVSCAQGGARFYLSESADGLYLQATDWAGHGQDFCELVDPSFTLGNEDDINSGSCSTCSTSVNVPLEGIEVYARGVLGESFARAEAPSWSYQTSVVQCAWMPNECNAR